MNNVRLNDSALGRSVEKLVAVCAVGVFAVACGDSVNSLEVPDGGPDVIDSGHDDVIADTSEDADVEDANVDATGDGSDVVDDARDAVVTNDTTDSADVNDASDTLLGDAGDASSAEDVDSGGSGVVSVERSAADQSEIDRLDEEYGIRSSEALEFCTDLMVLWCASAYDSECEEHPFQAGDRDLLENLMRGAATESCVAAMRLNYCFAILASERDEITDYDGDGAIACSGLFESYSCSNVYSEDYSQVSGCDDWLVGSGGVGDPCYFPFDCDLDDAICVGETLGSFVSPDDFEPGACTTVGGRLDPCDFSSDCEAGLECVDGLCR